MYFGKLGARFARLGSVLSPTIIPLVAQLLLGGADGVALASIDDSMVIRDTSTPANGFKGRPISKLGSIRTGSAMYWSQDGVLTWARQNALVQSQNLSTTWTFSNGAVISADGLAAPDGSMTADKVRGSTSNSTHIAIQTVSHGEGVFSAYLKAAEITKAMLFTSGSNRGYGFDLIAGTTSAVTGINAPAGFGIEDVGDGWYRCWIYTSTYTNVRIYLLANFDADTYAGANNTDGLWIWGAHLDRGPTPRDYVATTTAPYFELRRDFSPYLSGTPELCGYLFEGSRTNLLIQSQNFGLSWNLGAVVTSVNNPSPGAYSQATLLTDTNVGGNAEVNVQQACTVTAVPHTVSIFFKVAGVITWAAIQTLNYDAAANGTSYFNLGAGVLGTKHANHSASTIKAVGGGWYRCTITFTTTTDLIGTIRFNFADADGDISITRDGTKTLYVWGAQCEAGLFASSYILTNAASVTRAADIPFLTALPINVAEGTLYAKFATLGTGSVDQTALALDDNTTNEVISLRRTTARLSQFSVVDGGAEQLSTAGLTSVATVEAHVQTKSAARYKVNDCAVAQAGEAVQTDTSATMPTPTRLIFGNRSDGARGLNGWLFEAVYSNVAENDAQLAARIAA